MSSSMDVISTHYAAQSVDDIYTLRRGSFLQEYRVSPPASPELVTTLLTTHHRNREIPLSMPASSGDSTEYSIGIDTVEGDTNHGAKRSGTSGINGSGLPGTVFPGTADLPCSQTLQLRESCGDSSTVAHCTRSITRALEARKSRSQSRVRRASIGSVKEDITSSSLLILPRLVTSYL